MPRPTPAFCRRAASAWYAEDFCRGPWHEERAGICLHCLLRPESQRLLSMQDGTPSARTRMLSRIVCHMNDLPLHDQKKSRACAACCLARQAVLAPALHPGSSARAPAQKPEESCRVGPESRRPHRLLSYLILELLAISAWALMLQAAHLAHPRKSLAILVDSPLCRSPPSTTSSRRGSCLAVPCWVIPSWLMTQYLVLGPDLGNISDSSDSGSTPVGQVPGGLHGGLASSLPHATLLALRRRISTTSGCATRTAKSIQHLSTLCHAYHTKTTDQESLDKSTRVSARASDPLAISPFVASSQSRTATTCTSPSRRWLSFQTLEPVVYSWPVHPRKCGC